jgi:hypothetical protein
MASKAHRTFVVLVDRWLLLAILGLAGVIFFGAGELLGWFRDVGEVGFWLSLAGLIIGLVANASRSQAFRIERSSSRLEHGLGRVEHGVLRVEQGVLRVEQGVLRVEQGMVRVEQGVLRVEQGVVRVEQGVGRMEGHTAETNVLLRAILDRLPPQG